MVGLMFTAKLSSQSWLISGFTVEIIFFSHFLLIVTNNRFKNKGLTACLDTWRVIEEDSQALANYVQSKMTEYGVEETDYTITADGNPTNRAAATILQKPILWCIAHRLALVVESSPFVL